MAWCAHWPWNWRHAACASTVLPPARSRRKCTRACPVACRTMPCKHTNSVIRWVLALAPISRRQRHFCCRRQDAGLPVLPGPSMAVTWHADSTLFCHPRFEKRMKNIILVGAGRFARELLCWLEDGLDPTRERIAGLLDDTLVPAGELDTDYAYPLLGSIAQYQPAPDD